MESISFLGTSAATPGKDRNVSSFAIKFREGGRVWLVDCGEGTQHRVVRNPDIVKASKIDVILITHLHGDHCFGLPGLLASLSLTGVCDELTLIGPEGLKLMVDTAIGLSDTYLTYNLKIIELVEGEVFDLGLVNGIHLSAYPLVHKVATFGFVIEEPMKPGKLDGKKAAQLGAKGPVMRDLKNGIDVTLDDGTVIFVGSSYFLLHFIIY
eukprot:TRINITY_DN3594_c1_g1_i2.p1 TRINITY_DN3594_c1_g1~~TRINITY_DN3594_c1_g1_i2.p1  ORF type:complete len:210 (-),score=42.96 TRINITY_DN3594_c1_g1_i2:693-1322(-)